MAKQILLLALAFNCFVIAARSAVTVTAFTPTSAGAGTTVVITGTNFTSATVVSFGGTNAASFVVNNSTQITAVVGAGSSGSVLVTSPSGTGSKIGFTFVAAPTITSFTPTSAGPTLSVVITGTNFTAATAVSFGGTAATSFTVNSATQITAVVGSGTSGSVSVTTPGGTATLAGFTFYATPTITSFTPTSAGPTLSVVITGTNFTGATAVSFGGTPASSYTVNSSTQITAVVASGTSGSVAVTTPGGTVTKTGFIFVAAPTITSFTPTSAGPTFSVVITGTNFTGATAVSFGGTAASSYTVNSATQITAVVGSGTSGNVSVTTAGGTATLAGFTFYATPTVTAFTPTSGGTGTIVTITGTNLTGATAVTIGGAAVSSYTVASSTQITAVVAGGASGSVSVTTPGGTASLAGFTYNSPNAYIYIHQKTLNEQSAVDFAYTLTGTLSNASFSLNNNPAFIQIGDIGAGHGTTSSGNGDGEVWVIGNSASASYNVGAAGLTGGIYRRPSGSAQWAATNVTANILSIDGAYYNECVYVNSSGNVFFYYNGTSTQIYSGGNATDVAAGGGNIAIVAGGGIQVYNKQYVAGASIITTNGAWTALTGISATTATRLDLNLAGTSILYSYVNGTTETVYTTGITLSGGTGSTAGTFAQGSTATANTFTTSTDAYGNTIGGKAGNPDVAYDDKGYIYAMAGSQIYNAGDAVYSNTSGSYVYEPQSRAVQRISAASGGQAWGVIADGTANTIWARNTDGTHIWIDDERVRVSGVGYTYKTGGGTGTGNTNSGAGVSNGNVIMIPVPAGTYTVTETLPDATWDLGRFTNYVPSTSSVTTNVSAQQVTVTVAAGDVVHIEYFNEKLSPKAIALTCNASILEDFGTDVSTGGVNTFGDTVQGTAYHYYPQGNGTPTSSTAPQDGKYYTVKDLSHWFVNNGLQSHSNAGTGYYLVVNASYATDEFYRKRVTNLVPGLQYQITFYAANINYTTGNTVIRIPPNVSYGLQDANGNVVTSSTTGSIDSTGTTQWDLFSFTFTATTSQADFFLRNNTIGGLGNDIALDDISLNPVITPLPNITVSPAIAPNVCIGTNYTFANTQSGGIWTASPNTVATINAKTGKAKGLAAGAAVISYTYTNAIGCVSTTSTGIIASPKPTVATSDLLGGIACLNQGDSLYSTVSSGTTPYTYAWSASPSGAGLGISSIPNTNTFFTSSGTFTYTLVVTDAVGCTGTSSVAVTVGPNTAPTVTASATGPYCTNSSFALNSTETGGSGTYTYAWTATPTGNGLGTANTANTTATPTAAGSYIYKIVVNDGYCNVPKFVTATASSTPSVAVSGPTGTQQLCGNSSYALTSTPSGGSGTYSYAWTASTVSGLDNGPGLQAPTNTQNVTAKPTLTLSTALVPDVYKYSLTITDGNGCTASGSTSVTAYLNALSAAPTVAISTPTSATALCSGSTLNLTATATPATSQTISGYSWTGPGSYTSTSLSPGTITPTATGTYTLTVTQTNGCKASATTPTVTVNAAPTVSATSYASSECANTKDSIYATATGIGTLSYAWAATTVPAGGAAAYSPGATSASTGVTLNTVTGNYTFKVTVTDASNSCTASSSTVIAYSSNTGPSISNINSAATTCLGATTTLSPTVISGSTSGGSLTQLTPTTTGSNNIFSCSSISAANAFDGNTSTAFATSSAGNYYTGSAGTTVTTYPYGYVYADFGASYKISQITFYPVSGEEAAMNGGAFYGSNTAGNMNGATLLYTIPSTPAAGWNTVTAIGSTASFRYIYYQQGSGGTVTYLGPCGSIYYSPTYYCLVADIGIYSGTASSPIGIASYLWTGTPTGNGLGTTNTLSTTATPTAAGAYTYTLKVVDNTGCATSASTATQTVNGIPTVSTVANAPGFCSTSGSLALVAVVSGGSGTYTNYAWATTVVTSPGTTTVSPTSSTSSASTTATISGATAGTSQFKYTATVTDNNGCVGSGTSSILVVGTSPTLSTPTATIPTPCVGQTFTLNSTSFTGGTKPFNYNWTPSTGSTVTTSSGTISSSPVPSTTASATASGNYTFGLLLLDSNNCSASSSTAIVAVSQVSPSISTTCGNTNGTEWVQFFESNGATWAWSTTSGGRFYADATLSPATDGTTSSLQSPYVTYLGAYSVSITDVNGCTGTGSYTITSSTCAVTLAVTGLDFSAQKQGNEALLNWSTASETNNSHFDIERSADGINWQVIGTVQGKGNSTTLTKYSFTDALPMNGINYYRLTQVNADGAHSHSQTRALQFTGQWLVKLYPNPAQSFMVLEFDNDRDEKAAIVIQNLLGSTVYRTDQQLVKGFNRITLTQVAPLAQGTYIITLGTTENIFRSKFVKGSY